MAGHSKWSNIKHKKAAEDKKRAAIFAKLTKAITVAARDGGGDPETNYTLRAEIDKAKEFNLPKDKIETAIKRGTGELKDGADLEELLMEGLGPGGTAILIEVITDNRNRTAAEIRHILSDSGGKLAGEGSISWQFERHGVIYVPKKTIENTEEFELLAIEGDALDIENKDTHIAIHTTVDNTQKMLQYLQKNGYNKAEAELEWIPKNTVKPDEKTQKKLEKLFDALDEHDDVQDIYSNTE